MSSSLKLSLCLAGLALFGYSNFAIQLLARLFVLPLSIFLLYKLSNKNFSLPLLYSFNFHESFFVIYPLASLSNIPQLPTSHNYLIAWKSIEILLVWLLANVIVSNFAQSLKLILSFISKVFLSILVIDVILSASPFSSIFTINANTTTSLSLILLPLFLFTNNISWSFASFIVACLGISKTSLIALIFAFVIGSLLIIYRSLSRGKVSVPFLWLFLFGSMGSLLSFLFLSSKINFDSFSTLSGRSLIWEAYLSLVPDLSSIDSFFTPSNWFSGFGIGGTRFLFEAYGYLGVNRAVSAHNSFIEVFLSTGIVPFILFISFCLSFLYRFLRHFFFLSPTDAWLLFSSSLVILFRCLTSSSLALLTPELFLFLFLYKYSAPKSR